MDSLKTEKKLLKRASENVILLDELIEFLIIESNHSPEFLEVKEKFKLVKLALSAISITEFTSFYFIKFKKSIMERRVEKLLNYDYTKFIEKNIESDTDKLIRALIELIKNIWKRNNESVNFKIENFILKFLQISLRFNKYLKK